MVDRLVQVGNRVLHECFASRASPHKIHAQPLSILSNKTHYKECFVTGSHGGVPRHHELAVRLIGKGTVRVPPLITHRFPLSLVEAAFQTIESRQGMKIVMRPHGE